MNEIVEGKPYVYKCGGKELAKVLYYYGYIPNARCSEYKIICPFHNDLNPSMIIDLVKGTFYCFGCQKSGNAFQFVQYMNKNKSELQQMIIFMKILRSKKVNALDFSHRVKEKKEDKELYDIACDYYYGLSKVDWKNEKTEEVIFSKEYMMKRGFTSDTLNKCGAKITYNKLYEIIFPMFDNFEFKGWVCRTIDKEVEKKRKYLYNEGFSRANTLVGKYEGCEVIIVVEGYMDRLKFIQFGVENVVAILGWKMSREQEMKLKKSGVKYIISALDNDKCGRKGTEYLRSIFKNVIRFKYLKGFKDPGEMEYNDFIKMYNKTMHEIDGRNQ